MKDLLKSREFWVVVAVAIVLYIIVQKTGALKSEGNYSDVIAPGDATDGELSNDQIRNIARGVNKEFTGWNFSSGGQDRIMKTLNNLTDTNLTRVNNAYIQLYAGASIRETITAEWYVWGGSERAPLLERLDSLGL